MWRGWSQELREELKLPEADPGGFHEAAGWSSGAVADSTVKVVLPLWATLWTLRTTVRPPAWCCLRCSSVCLRSQIFFLPLSNGGAWVRTHVQSPFLIYPHTTALMLLFDHMFTSFLSGNISWATATCPTLWGGAREYSGDDRCNSCINIA